MLSFVCCMVVIYAAVVSVRNLIFGPYNTADYPERSAQDAQAAWGERTYATPEKARWAYDSAMGWAAGYSAPSKKDAYKALAARLDYYLD